MTLIVFAWERGRTEGKPSMVGLCGLPLIGQKQKRPMNGAQFHSQWVGKTPRSV
jgi:hypothetical protein